MIIVSGGRPLHDAVKRMAQDPLYDDVERGNLNARKFDRETDCPWYDVHLASTVPDLKRY